jgi:hypothetical protein
MQYLSRHLFVIILAGGYFGAAAATNIEKLALLSDIGDSMTVVIHQPSVGTHLDSNLKEVIALPDATFDDTAIKAAMDALERLSTPAPFSTVAPTLASASKKLTISAGVLTPSKELEGALRSSGATHLLLFTKYRADSMLKMASESIGSGKLEGLGFYIDQSFRMRRSDTGESGTGFLAPFAYFQVSLVDLTSWEILKTEAVMASTTLSGARLKQGSNPWDILAPEQKVAILQKLIQKETLRVIPILLESK